jgi:hypothetical protein
MTIRLPQYYHYMTIILIAFLSFFLVPRRLVVTRQAFTPHASSSSGLSGLAQTALVLLTTALAPRTETGSANKNCNGNQWIGLVGKILNRKP